MAGGARLRVRIDVQRLRSNMQMHGRTLTEKDIEAWLHVVGFQREPLPPRMGRGAEVARATAGSAAERSTDSGATWLTDAENLRCLDRSEILDVTPAG